MIENNTQNVQLSFEQLQQLGAFQSRLSKLDGEIAAANKNLRELRLETETTIKEKEYQQGLLNDVTSQVSGLEEKKSVLEIAVATAEATIETHAQKTEELRISQGEHASKMSQELNDLHAQKESHAKAWEDISKEKEQVSNSRKEVEAARQILDNAVKSIQWKNQ